MMSLYVLRKRLRVSEGQGESNNLGEGKFESLTWIDGKAEITSVGQRRESSYKYIVTESAIVAIEKMAE